jgi:hypothetical protein
MNRCVGTKRDNSPCTVTVEPPKIFCWWHDPDNSEQRSKAASRGGKRAGRGRPLAEVAEVKSNLKNLAAAVLTGNVDRSDAAVVAQVLNIWLRTVSVELKVREELELVGRLEALEEAQEAQARAIALAIRSRVQRLERGARKNSASFELTDGSMHYFDPTSGELFLHACECIRAGAAGESFPDPPRTIQALTKARDRAGALQRVAGNSLFPYELGPLRSHGQLVPAEWIMPLEDLSE